MRRQSGKSGQPAGEYTARKATGQKDPVIQLLRELCTETGRARHDQFFVEGAELTRRALDFGARVRSVVLSEHFAAGAEGAHLLDKTAHAGCAVCTASAGLLAKTLGAKPTPDCVAILPRGLRSPEDAIGGRASLVLLVDHGESADNLGMLLRSTDAAGIDAVVLSTDTTDAFSRRSVRGSRGAVMTVPLCVTDAVEAIALARKRGMQVVASSVTGDVEYTDVDYTKPTMAVVGNEHTGISPRVRRAADTVARVPMLGRLSSLNIAVAASLLMYEAVRQRRASSGA